VARRRAPGAMAGVQSGNLGRGGALSSRRRGGPGTRQRRRKPPRVLQLPRSGGTATQGCGVAVTGGSRRWRGNCCRQPWRCRPRSWPRQTQVRVLPRSGQLQWAAGFFSLSFLFRSSWLLVLTSARVTAGIRCTRRAAARRWI
jgi:hypothetical protein